MQFEGFSEFDLPGAIGQGRGEAVLPFAPYDGRTCRRQRRFMVIVASTLERCLLPSLANGRSGSLCKSFHKGRQETPTGGNGDGRQWRWSAIKLGSLNTGRTSH